MTEHELSFINLSGKPTQDVRDTNKVVRSHVMRRYKRQKRIEAQKDANSNSAVSGSSKRFETLLPIPSQDLSRSHPDSATDSCIDRTSDTGARIIAVSRNDCCPVNHCWGYVNPKTWLDGDLDPFSSLPIRSTPRCLMLLQQNTASPIRTSVHADLTNAYRKACSDDPAWLFMSMFYAASRFPSSSKLHIAEAADYLMRSISAVNQSIEASPYLISDSVIATVACLANIENLNGSLSDAKIHMDGLIHMVELKGGLERLGIHGILRRMVLWSDLLVSCRSAKAPHFPFCYQLESPIHLSYFTPAEWRECYLLSLNNDLADIISARHHVSVSEVLLSLHELSTFLNILAPRELPWDAAYPDRVYMVECQILLSLFDDRIATELEHQSQLADILLHSSLLFIYTNLRETPVGGAIRGRLLDRLKLVLQASNIAHYSTRFTSEVLWALFLGASAADEADQAYYLSLLSMICHENRVYSWVEIQKLLEHMPTLEAGCLSKCVAVWNTMTRASCGPN